MQWINGKKTYILAGITILGAWASVWAGTTTTQDAINLTLAALGGVTIRQAIAKGPTNPPSPPAT